MDENKVNPDNISNQNLWKKLGFLQEKLLELEAEVTEIKKKTGKIEDAVTPKGGIQPSSKGLNIFEQEDGKKTFTDVGKDIFKHLRKNKSLTRNELEDILVEHNITRSKPTHLDYLKNIAAEIQEYSRDSTENFEVQYKSGKQGGKGGGRPSRVILSYD